MAGRKTLVVGGGKVAQEKVAGLLAAGAAITVLAPQISPRLQSLAAAGTIAYQPQEYFDGALAGYEVCFVATETPQTPNDVEPGVAGDILRLGGLDGTEVPNHTRIEHSVQFRERPSLSVASCDEHRFEIVVGRLDSSG